ncbi:putative ribonuclease H-like domain-containing protein, partial [Tanacetum coccineum]
LWYPQDSPFQLEAYSDSDYAGSHGDRKSTTGGCQFLGRRLISWQCKKQTIVATSSIEAEYVAAASCCAQSTIYIVKYLVFHQRTKHIEIRHHFIRDANEKNLIQVLKIHTDDNVVDLLEKAFRWTRFAYRWLVSSLLLVGLGSAGKLSFLRQPLVSAGCTWFLLYLSSCCNPWFLLVLLWFLLIVIFPAGRLVSAGCTMVLLVVIFPAGRLVSAGCTMVLLVVICSCWTFELPAVYMVSLWLLFLLHKSLVFILLYIQSCWWKQCICIA